jgi:hypothetical protein
MAIAGKGHNLHSMIDYVNDSKDITYMICLITVAYLQPFSLPNHRFYDSL